MNHRMLIGQYLAFHNPHLARPRRFRWFMTGVGYGLALVALVGLLWFVCNIVVVAK
jgi:hypothetical protein